MSNLVENFKESKIKTITSIYNRLIANINNNYQNSLLYLRRSRINSTQKQSIINNLNNKYKQSINNLKLSFDNEIQKINSISENIISTTSEAHTKKALIIGINYIGTSSRLNGCINDAKSIETYLKGNDFTSIKLLTDETDIKPTKLNILNELKNILETSNKNDTIFIFYSGHGSYTLDRNGDELDGYDELIVPLDFNYIRDDDIKAVINTYGKPDTNLIALFDCCNSGTALDLKYQILEKLNYDDITENTRVSETPCNTLFISGCRDEQVSIETTVNNETQGLMTWSFLQTVSNNNPITWRNLVKQMRELLKTKSYQIPQLSSGKLFNPDTNFTL